MYNLKWSESEKKISRELFDSTLQAELNEVMGAFKSMAMSAAEPADMWAVRDFLAKKQHEIDQKYNDYRHSQLIFVFGRLVREGRIQMAQLAGLSEDKVGYIKRIVGA